MKVDDKLWGENPDKFAKVVSFKGDFKVGKSYLAGKISMKNI